MKLLLPLHGTILTFNNSEKMAFKTLWENEKMLVLLFQQCFLVCQIYITVFHQSYFVVCKLFQFGLLKFCHLVKGLEETSDLV